MWEEKKTLLTLNFLGASAKNVSHGTEPPIKGHMTLVKSKYK